MVSGPHLLGSHNLPRGDVCVGTIAEAGERGGDSELQCKAWQIYDTNGISPSEEANYSFFLSFCFMKFSSQLASTIKCN